jgi:XTP/dITP diphosphohydrolase
MQRVLYATNNSGKIFEVSRHLEPIGIQVTAPADLGISIEVPETGTTLEENAFLKARAFREQVKDMIIIADDTGLEIDALGGEPGVFVRRWRDHVNDMDDQEIIEYTLERMAGISQDKRGAQFRTVMAVIFPDGREEQVDGILRGFITEEANKEVHIPGLPFEGLFYVPEWGYLLGETRKMEHGDKQSFLSHREKAASKVAELVGKKAK